MELTDLEFANLCHYIRGVCGLAVTEEKKYLIQQRLEPLAEELGCQSFTALYMRIKDDPHRELQEKVVIAMTTNETSFFRDEHPFRSFEAHLLPEIYERFRQRQKNTGVLPYNRINIWCAAASSGQEPYSILMVINEFCRENRRRLGCRPEQFNLLATDIDNSMLDQAREGRYNKVEMRRGLSQELRERYFEESGAFWVAKEELRDAVEYRCLNLTEPFTSLGRFEVIFCRNVLIYFDEETKTSVLQQFHHMLNPGGYLILGSSESLYMVDVPFESVRRGESVFYRKR
jgi:chemotaxis protein methyltransferase CheR